MRMHALVLAGVMTVIFSSPVPAARQALVSGKGPLTIERILQPGTLDIQRIRWAGAVLKFG